MPPELAVLVRAGDQVAIGGKALAVGPAGRLHPDGDFVVIGRPAQNLAARLMILIGEKNIAVLVGRAAFGEAVASGKPFPAWRHRR